MHQYIREQADALAQRGWKNTSSHESGGDMKSQGKYHPTRDRTLGKGGQIKGDQSLVRASKKETQKQKIPTKSGKPDQLTHV